MSDALLVFFADKSLDQFKGASRAMLSGAVVDVDDLKLWGIDIDDGDGLCCGVPDTFEHRHFDCPLHSPARWDHLGACLGFTRVGDKFVEAPNLLVGGVWGSPEVDATDKEVAGAIGDLERTLELVGAPPSDTID